MDKPPEEFSSSASFYHVLAEVAKYVPGLLDDDPAAPAATQEDET
jgi:hypothetical protein